MKIFRIGTVFFIISATQASALSCLPPNIARSFNNANALPYTYVLAQGFLSPMGRVPKYKAGKGRNIRTRFNGVLLSSTGKTAQQSFTVTVDTACYGDPCGELPDEKQELVALFRKTAFGYRLQTNPCGGDYKSSPTPKDIHLLQSCLKNGGCSEAQVKSLDNY
jgi:hypothetical protein